MVIGRKIWGLCAFSFKLLQNYHLAHTTHKTRVDDKVQGEPWDRQHETAAMITLPVSLKRDVI